jgi:hypothetical protein
VKDHNKIIRNISVAIAGIFGNCGNLAQQNALLKNKIVSVSITYTIFDTIHLLVFYLKTRRFGDWILF